MPDPWTPVDPLGEALHFLRMSGVFYTRSEFSAPWGLEMPAMPGTVMFHAVTAGSCWLAVGEREPRHLRPGEFALVPHGEGHRLLSEPGAATPDLFSLPLERVSERYEILRHGGGGEPTGMICGAVRLGHPAAQHLLALLPSAVVIEPWRTPEADWMQSALRLMGAETQTIRPGGEAIVTRLADILVIQAIRAWIREHGAAEAGWLGALRDEQIGPAMLLVHREPERDWTVASLAEEVAMSRSAFTARFSALVGEPPMAYVRRWRMYAALTLLRDGSEPLAAIADKLGYRSEAAFSRAFKRVMGTTPGAARREARREQNLSA